MKTLSIIGHVGSPPKVWFTDSGKRIATISVGVSEKITNRQTGEKEQKTDWFKVTLFGYLIDVVEKWVDTGTKIYVNGRFKAGLYQDKNGETQISLEILANEIELLNKVSEQNQKSASKPTSFQKESHDFDHDIPF